MNKTDQNRLFRHTEFKELARVNGYTVLGEYVNAGTPISIKHNECGNIYPVRPSHFKRLNNRCPKCSGKSKKHTMDKFITYLTCNGYTLVDSYIDSRTKITVRHKCNTEYKVNPSALMSGGYKCPLCSPTGNAALKMQKEKELNDLASTERYQVLDRYIDANTPVRLFHELCGTEFSIKPTLFKVKGTRCPQCSRSGGFNSGLPATFYVVRWRLNGDSFVKFGITNDYELRIKQQTRKTQYKPELIYKQNFDDGNIPNAIETNLKSSMITGVIDRTKFGDGFTETVSDTDHNIEFIYDALKKGA